VILASTTAALQHLLDHIQTDRVAPLSFPSISHLLLLHCFRRLTPLHLIWGEIAPRRTMAISNVSTNYQQERGWKNTKQALDCCSLRCKERKRLPTVVLSWPSIGTAHGLVDVAPLPLAGAAGFGDGGQRQQDPVMEATMAISVVLDDFPSSPSLSSAPLIQQRGPLLLCLLPH